jgi:uncharacterized RDD family membrane protein YckC
MTAEPGRPDQAAPDFAGLVTRTLAFALDAAIINLTAWAVGAVVALGLSLLAIPEDVRNVIALIGAGVALAWTFGYFVFFWSASGQTPGNRVLGIAVRDGASGEPIRARRAAIRLLLLPLSALPLCAGFLMILVDPRRRALHDWLIGTVVVNASGERRARRAERERAVMRAEAEVGRRVGVTALSGRPARP